MGSKYWALWVTTCIVIFRWMAFWGAAGDAACMLIIVNFSVIIDVIGQVLYANHSPDFLLLFESQVSQFWIIIDSRITFLFLILSEHCWLLRKSWPVQKFITVEVLTAVCPNMSMSYAWLRLYHFVESRGLDLLIWRLLEIWRRCQLNSNVLYILLNHVKIHILTQCMSMLTFLSGVFQLWRFLLNYLVNFLLLLLLLLILFLFGRVCKYLLNLPWFHIDCMCFYWLISCFEHRILMFLARSGRFC